MRVEKITASALSIGLLLGATGAAADDETSETLPVAISGVVAGGGSFAGTLSIKKFAARDGQVVAVGMLSGSLTNALGAPAGTALVGPIVLPVQVGPGAAARTAAAAGAVIPQQTCDVLHLEVQPITLDVLGLQVTTLPVGIDIVADPAGVLGHLICTILETLHNVIGLVDLLNALLGLLTGLV